MMKYLQNYFVICCDQIFIIPVSYTHLPGLCAKPIIDMLLVVKDSADELSYVPALESAGYIAGSDTHLIDIRCLLIYTAMMSESQRALVAIQLRWRRLLL